MRRSPSPAPRRAVRGKSGIAEIELTFGVFALRAAWVDGRGFFDDAEVAAFKEAQGDQIGKAQDRDLDAMAAAGGEGGVAEVVEGHVGLGRGEEERARLSDRGPPAVMAIALVKDIGAPASIAIVRPIWASLRLASVMSRMLGQSAFGSKTTCIFRPRMHPFDLAQSHSLPSGMGIASISLTIVAPSRRVCRSS